MSGVAVIHLSAEQFGQVEGLLGEARTLKTQLETLGRQKKEKDAEINAALHAIALGGSESYRAWHEEGNLGHGNKSLARSHEMRIPTLREDHHSVVILVHSRDGSRDY